MLWEMTESRQQYARSAKWGWFWSATMVCHGFLDAAHAEEGQPTFAEEVAPIIYQNCVSCHRPGGVGPFSFLSYEDVHKRSRQISEVVEDRFMPPWQPSLDHGPKVRGERTLSESEIDVISAWHESGALPGDLDRAPAPPVFDDAWQLGPPDVVLEFPEPFILPAAGRDIYRNFVIPIPLERPRRIRAIEFLPDSNIAVHHALLLFDATDASQKRDEHEPGPGFDGMGIGSAEYPSGQFIGWAPGQVPFEVYPGTQWSIEPGTDLVLQMHMLPTGKPEPVNPRIGLYFTDEPPTRVTTVIQLRDLEIDIPAGENEYIVEQSMMIPVRVSVLGLFPHAHYLGKDLQVFANLPDGSTKWLLRIPQWDFNWQSDYRYEKPEPLPAGSEVVMRYTFDNSADNIHNPFDPPRRVRTGWNSTDEMAEVVIQLLLDDPADKAKVQKAQLGYEIESAGGLAQYSYNFGSHFEQQGMLERAAAFYETATREDPGFASAWYKLGSVRNKLGDKAAAEQFYREALFHQPDLIPPTIGLANILYQTGQPTIARNMLEGIVVEVPGHLEARLFLARLLAAEGEASGAAELLEAGLRWHENDLTLRLELGQMYDRTGDLRAAREHLLYASSHEPVSADPLVYTDVAKLQAEALFSLGEVYRRMGDMFTAEEYYRESLARVPWHRRALLASASVAIEFRNFDLANERLASVVVLVRDEGFPVGEVLAQLPDRKSVV